MGASLVVLALGAELKSHAARLVLTRMAVTAKDADSVPRYWDGWEPLASALGRTPNEDGTWPTSAAENAARRAVDRTVATLIRDGLIERTNVPRPGLQAEYVLKLDRSTPVEKLSNGPR